VYNALMNKVTTNELAGILANTDGQIFSCEFIKRTTGELRKMVCRTGVTIGVKGVGHRFDPIQKGLIQVWDVQVEQFRFISIEGLKSAKVGGKEYVCN